MSQEKFPQETNQRQNTETTTQSDEGKQVQILKNFQPNLRGKDW